MGLRRHGVNERLLADHRANHNVSLDAVAGRPHAPVGAKLLRHRTSDIGKPVRVADRGCVRSAFSTLSESLARCRSSIRNASEVASTPTRLRSTSASLRICIVATSATSNAISHTLTPLIRLARRGVLGRADIWYLEA